MPNWSGGILTVRGQALQAKVDAGHALTLTKMKIGSGVLPAGQNLQDLTDLVSPEKNISISGIAAKDNITTITGVITNGGLAIGFHVRELGIFAQDPDVGEILYSVTADSAPDYLPAEGGSVAVSQEFNYHIAVSNAAQVSAVLSTSGLVTVGMLQQHTHDGTGSNGPKISYNNLVDKPPDPVFFGLEAPTAFNQSTLWLRNVGGAPDSSTGSGVVIANATTSSTPPDPSNYWFDEQE
ncbi:hypothetical protein [Sporomusa sp.]|uniref:hypothetical protein n=1 Tax=Sporomusa sp. TaxID=2078658 RepID=UPI002C9BCB70|nr:hypothetical protein [Sporomusa sp.]HWR07740.1 hypothetical protein [Sporomusa sp.]